jgi:hypothetical protein
MMGFVHSWVAIQAWVDHDSVDEVIDDGRDAIYTPKPLIKALLILPSHLMPPSFSSLLFDVGDIQYTLIRKNNEPIEKKVNIKSPESINTYHTVLVLMRRERYAVHEDLL